jgi:hypothetical protein
MPPINFRDLFINHSREKKTKNEKFQRIVSALVTRYEIRNKDCAMDVVDGNEIKKALGGDPSLCGSQKFDKAKTRRVWEGCEV